MKTTLDWKTASAFALAAAIVAAAYWPGLSGPFLFDDFSNLNVIGSFGRLDNWRSILLYLTSGEADPIGRPVALLSFMIDAHGWPNNPWPFKRTNVLLHLLNTCLLAAAIWKLDRARRITSTSGRASNWTPALAALIWASHPFFVSTTLYVVQREAMLPMTFGLAALIFWLKALESFTTNKPLKGWTLVAAGSGLMTLLAALSKANGLLTPLLIGIIHFWFLRQTTPVAQSSRHIRVAAVLALIIPSLAILGYLVREAIILWNVPHLNGRDWTLPQRLLSEPRAIWTYLAKLAIPRAGGGGVFVEHFAASRSWLEPWTTTPAMVALGLLISGIIALRNRFPLGAFALAFFLGGHLMESSSIALELYFEHRNYWPAAFLGWPIASAIAYLRLSERIKQAIALGLVSALLLLTFQRAIAWGDSATLALTTAHYEPQSVRAQTFSAKSEFDRGLFQQALSRAKRTSDLNPASIDAAITLVGMECTITGTVSEKSMKRALTALETATKWNYGLYDWLTRATRDPALQRCRGLGNIGLTALIDAIARNPRQGRAKKRTQTLEHIRGHVALSNGDVSLAARHFDHALQLAPSGDYALVQAAILGGNGAPSLGIKHLDLYSRLSAKEKQTQIRDMKTLHEHLLVELHYKSNEIERLRRLLTAEAATEKSDIPHKVETRSTSQARTP